MVRFRQLKRLPYPNIRPQFLRCGVPSCPRNLRQCADFVVMLIIRQSLLLLESTYKWKLGVCIYPSPIYRLQTQKFSELCNKKLQAGLNDNSGKYVRNLQPVLSSPRSILCFASTDSSHRQ